MLLLVAAALFIAQAINFTLLLREVSARRANFVIGGAVARTVDTIERIEAGVPIGSRSPGPDRLVVTLGQPVASKAPRDRLFEDRLRQALAEAGRPANDVRAVGGTDIDGRERLSVSVRFGNGRWINLRSSLPPGPAFILPLLGQTAILFLSLLVAVIAIGRHVARPLRRLTKATETLGSSREAQPVALDGPGDVQHLISTFNRMQTRIVDMLDEKDRMLGAIGHDLRTPLASLRLRAETVPDPVERHRIIDTIEEMDGTLDDILSLARNGRPSEAKASVDLSALVDALCQDLQDLGFRVSFEDGDRVVAKVRPVLMRRAIRNLVENAAKYGVEAKVRLHVLGRHAIIEIDDEGPGIAEADLERVQDGFVRLETSRNRKTGGSGLGLTIARGIIHEHEGDLHLANGDKQGLCVTVRLPLS